MPDFMANEVFDNQLDNDNPDYREDKIKRLMVVLDEFSGK